MIKKDFDFVMKVLNNKDNKFIHLPALRNLINNFKNKWDDNLGPGVSHIYVNRLNKKYKNVI
tara:strand:- start:3870 stop:4055 length:186 start_codon:yes stop_codon:yes gene_type:complete